MVTQKFVLPNYFFKITPRLETSAISFNDLTIMPNFDNTFFFNRKSIGSTISSYCSALKSHSGYYSVLHVNGIGFKIFYFGRQHSLYFSLGYNHIVKFKLPKELTVKVRKQYLLLFSYNKSSLGTSVYQIQHLRFPDPYRGKGIRFRFQIITFKLGKQR
jgi:ribosomal protein L6P/L9E